MSIVLRSIFLIFPLILAGVSRVKCEKSARPNILLLLADDAGFEAGAYLNKIVQTPNIDALARRSLLFNNAFVSVSSCSPSRAAILTGQPSHENGMYGLHNGYHHFNAFDNVQSLPNLLRSHAIKTGLIGKKHLGPFDAFRFDFEATEEHHAINQVGRNITNMKLLVREFLANVSDSQFFLTVAFHDPHRCGRVTPQFGPFCERFGSGEQGMGIIEDWRPIYYQWEQVQLPFYMPDTEPARRDIAAQYTTISRLDQGIGLILREIESAGRASDTLVIYTSDNGPPFPSGRTNFYEPGMNVPLLLSSPDKKRWHEVTYAMTSHLDLLPTFLDWFGIPQTTTDKNVVISLTGKSLLPLLDRDPPANDATAVFGSHNFHEVTMAYPMRVIRDKRYKLIHNLNYGAPFPIDQDFYVSWTFQDILNRTMSKTSIPWYKTLRSYYMRPEFELFDLKKDPGEMRNLAYKKEFFTLRTAMEERLGKWQEETNDPWRCAPHGVLEDRGDYKANPSCLTLAHDEM